MIQLLKETNDEDVDEDDEDDEIESTTDEAEITRMIFESESTLVTESLYTGSALAESSTGGQESESETSGDDDAASGDGSGGDENKEMTTEQTEEVLVTEVIQLSIIHILGSRPSRLYSCWCDCKWIIFHLGNNYALTVNKLCLE